MRSAPEFQLATRPAPSSMKMAWSWTPSTSRRKLSWISRGALLVGGGAGVEWDTRVGGVGERGWPGVECLSGIPGTVGGTPIQTVGAYGQEIAETLVSATCLDRTTLDRRTFSARDCAFGYRDSRFKRGDRDRYVVLGIVLRLGRDPPPR